MKILEEGRPLCRIVHEEGPVYAFAAAELAKYLRLMSKAVFPIGDGEGACVYIGSLEWCAGRMGTIPAGERPVADGYVVAAGENAAMLSGNEPRSALYAVYHALEGWGCAWPFPGIGGETVPAVRDASLPEGWTVESPSFEKRGIMYGGDCVPQRAFDAQTEEIIDWMAKNRLNCYFLHVDVEHLFPAAYQAAVNSAVVRRGMRLELGGHGFQNLVLPRTLYDSHPEWFIEKGGKRVREGNFCITAAGVDERAYQAVRRLMEAYPQAQTLHLYYDDVPGGSWCTCEGCRDLTAAQQAYAVHRAVAERLKREECPVELAYCCYHDTLDTRDLQEAPPENLLLFIAPRERCYRHAVGEGDCPRNVGYDARIGETARRWPQNAYMMEYYMDLILFSNMKTVLPSTISGDLRRYYEQGMRSISSLDFGPYSWYAYDINYFVYARCAWDVEADAAALVREAAESVYPDHAVDMEGYFSEAEEASGSWLSFCGYTATFDIRDCYTVKGHETFYRKHIGLVEQALERTEGLIRRLTTLIAEAHGQEALRLQLERDVQAITREELLAVWHRLKGVYAYQVNKEFRAAEEHIERTLRHKRREAALVRALSPLTAGCSGTGEESIMIRHNCFDQSDWTRAHLKQIEKGLEHGHTDSELQWNA